WRTARAAFERARKLAPADAEPLTGLVLVDFKEGKKAAAIDRATKAVEANPNNPQFLLVAANADYSVGDVKNAESLARRAIEIDPNASEGYSLLAKVHLQNG